MFSEILALDLGSSKIRLANSKSGILYDQASLIAINPYQKKYFISGNAVIDVMGRESDSLQILRFIKAGKLQYYQYSIRFFRNLLKEYSSSFKVLRPILVVSVPNKFTLNDRKILVDILIQAGARKVFMIPQNIAVAIGSGIPTEKIYANLVVNLGAHISESSVISANNIIENCFINIAGESINQKIIDFCYSQGVLISWQKAEDLKVNHLTATVPKSKQMINISGRSLSTGMPIQVEIETIRLYRNFVKNLSEIVNMVQETMKELSPAISQDIANNGIILAGGFSQFRNLDNVFSHLIGIPVYLADNPATATIRGLGIISNQIKDFIKSPFYEA